MDLADQIDDYICSFEGLGDLTMDSLAIFIFLWAVLALFSVWLIKLLYNKYLNKDKSSSAANSRQTSVAPTSGSPSSVAGKTEKRLSEPRDLLATKSKVEDLSKPLTGGSGGRGRSSASPLNTAGAAAGGPRRRVVRQSSTGPENRKKRYVPPPSNVVGPETSSVTWTSQVFRWLYSDLVIVNELLMSWVIAINDTLRKSVEEHGVAVEVVRVLPDSPAPGLNNIFCNCDENNPADMLITFDCDAMPVLQVKTFRQKAGKVETSHYKVTVSRFRARMAIPMNYNTLKGEMRVEGYPDVRIAMNSVGAIKAMDQDEQQLQTVISDILTTALRDTVYPVDFSIYSTCPRAEVEPLDLPVIYPVHYDSLAHNMEHHLGGVGLRDSQHMVSGRRLLVKIVKGEGIREAQNPYVVIEMDEPAQKNQTGTQRGTKPFWDEHFLFELSPQSAEILFEVYDHPVIASDPPKFLGLGLVGIDELAVGPASTQLLQLQPRPYETQPVSGAITVDFVFIEGAEIPVGVRPQRLKEALRLSTPAINEHIRNGADLADAAVRALQDGALSGGSGVQPSKSTLIIHSVQRNSSSPNAFKVEVNKEGQIEVTETATELDQAVAQAFERAANEAKSELELEQAKEEKASQLGETLNDSGNGTVNEESTAELGQPNAASSPNGSGYHNNYSLNGNGNTNGAGSGGYNSLPRNGGAQQLAQHSGLIEGHDVVDDRGRSKKRNFFGTLKKRLSRSKTRTLSADQPNNNSHKSLSATNSNTATATGFPRTATGTLNESSAISGFSSASNKTYVHEASTLVLETIENGVKRHFIVPLAIAQRPRWRRKGTKLHIYNDHTFIAKHLSGSGLQCSICMKSIPRRPGKQGYECRDCQLICHKQCHIRAPQACPNPTVLSMELTSFPVLTERDLNLVN
ncbi:uncharacterized protein [Drosophila suzukii]|uniref:Uncharacterized protein isoform X14 n=1 Tax=Drosophila suzukii TaxID=28584 RepID=A0AB40D474_DROSZ